MFKKSLVIISSILIVVGLFACGNNAEVEELKRQVAELKEQNEQKVQNDVEENNNNNKNQVDDKNDISSQIRNAKVLSEYNEDTKLEELDTIVFGHDENNNSLEWVVLEKDANTNRAWLLSKYCVALQPYDTIMHENLNWETSFIRRWLNGPFYYEAFNDIERESIVTFTVDNSPNESEGTKGENNTDERLFLLSIDEYDTLNRNYSIALEDNDSAGESGWWLRSIKKGDNVHMFGDSNYQVMNSGAMSLSGDCSTLGGVRPAMVVKY